MCSVPYPDVAQHSSAQFHAVSYPLVTSPDELLCWFTSTLRSAGVSLLSRPVTFHSHSCAYCATLTPHTPGCPTVLTLTAHHRHSINRDRANHNSVRLLNMFLGNIILQWLSQKTDQQERTDWKSQAVKKTGVPGRSRLLHHACQRHFALNPLCPKYHSLTCSNPGAKHWNLLLKGVQAYAAWIARSSPDSRLGWAGRSEDSSNTLMYLCS